MGEGAAGGLADRVVKEVAETVESCGWGIWHEFWGRQRSCASLVRRGIWGSVPGYVRAIWRAKWQEKGWGSFMTAAQRGQKNTRKLLSGSGVGETAARMGLHKSGALTAIEVF